MKKTKIILGVTGSISAYKSPLLLREFIKNGFEVQPIITDSASKFVSPLVLSNLSGNHTINELFDDSISNQGAWHIKLAHSADMMIIAPCSATTLSKLASGIIDNALLTVTLSMPKGKPVVIAPAMDTDMWESSQVQNNIKLLKSYGYHIIEPEVGDLSSGLIGKGRLPEIATIFEFCTNILDNQNKYNELKKRLVNKNILITAGGTIEKIDAVRYLSNFSSGKMGFALAEAANQLGAKVCLIAGNVSTVFPEVDSTVNIQGADQMFEAVSTNQKKQDILIFAAAVADYKPKKESKGKLKKEQLGESPNIELIQTVDILKNAVKNKEQGQIIVGFALESENSEENAIKKLESKGCDYIILNTVGKNSSPFGSDENYIKIYDKSGKLLFEEKNSKKNLAYSILEIITNHN